MVRAVKHLPLPFAVLLLAACAPPGDAPPPATPAPPASSAVATAGPSVAAEEPVPTLRLPSDTRPTAEAIELHIDPTQDRFSGVVDIDVQLDHPRSVIWLHGDDLNVTAASVTADGGGPLTGTWKQRSDTGFASLTLAQPRPAGEARIHIAYDAPFSRGQMGLYKATEAGVPYAFTQFETIAARKAFPCFDEPGFKIPFMTSLVVPAQLQAIANAHEVSRVADKSSPARLLRPDRAAAELPRRLRRRRRSTWWTPPVLPPNDVRTTPLRLRGVTAKGRGKEIAYALAHTGEILATLEGYFGIPYPYDKLDILAVPGKGGAMENAGAVTFGEGLLLMDEATASVSQRRGYASVVAHELAHQWTGDLVTMQWWDDTWLNEAFATWIGQQGRRDLGSEAPHGTWRSCGSVAGGDERRTRW